MEVTTSGYSMIGGGADGEVNYPKKVFLLLTDIAHKFSFYPSDSPFSKFYTEYANFGNQIMNELIERYNSYPNMSFNEILMNETLINIINSDQTNSYLI